MALLLNLVYILFSSMRTNKGLAKSGGMTDLWFHNSDQQFHSEELGIAPRKA